MTNFNITIMNADRKTKIFENEAFWFKINHNTNDAFYEYVNANISNEVLSGYFSQAPDHEEGHQYPQTRLIKASVCGSLSDLLSVSFY